jgi:hypothetical protein
MTALDAELRARQLSDMRFSGRFAWEQQKRHVLSSTTVTRRQQRAQKNRRDPTWRW